MRTETTAKVSCVKQHIEAPESHPVPPAWDAFPQPQGWAMAWDSRGLGHEVQSTRGRASGNVPSQA
jgi:hypothetical protein